MPFLKPTGMDSPDAISRWVWLSIVRAPIAAQAIASPKYCGAMGSRTSPKEAEFEHFAHELAQALHDGHGQQAYKRIVLVAPPHFLGLLRKMLNDTVSKLISAEDRRMLVPKTRLESPSPTRRM